MAKKIVSKEKSATAPSVVRKKAASTTRKKSVDGGKSVEPAKKLAEPAKRKRQRLPAEARKAQIISAAQKVFVRHGLKGTRTRDLAKEAGVNEATLFLYFKNKQEIFDAAILDPLTRLVSQQTAKGKMFAAAKDESSKISIGVKAHEEIFSFISELYPLFATALFSDEKMGREIYINDIYPMIVQLGKAAKMSFNLKDNESGEFIALASLGMSFTMLSHQHFLGLKKNSDVTASRIANLIIHGVSKKS